MDLCCVYIPMTLEPDGIRFNPWFNLMCPEVYTKVTQGHILLPVSPWDHVKRWCKAATDFLQHPRGSFSGPLNRGFDFFANTESIFPFWFRLLQCVVTDDENVFSYWDIALEMNCKAKTKSWQSEALSVLEKYTVWRTVGPLPECL